MSSMKTTQCRRAEAQALLFLAGELEPAEAATVRAHLRSCPHCGALAAELAEVQDQVSSTLRSAIATPPTLESRVMATVRRLPPSHPTWPAFRPPWSRQTRTFLMVAGVCLLLIGYVAGRVMLAAPDLEPDGAQLGLNAPGAPPQMQLAELRQDYLSWLNGTRAVTVPGGNAQEVSGRMAVIQCHAAPVAPVTFAEPNTRMLGGCWHTVRGVPIAFLSYSWNGRPICLYQADNRKLSLPAMMPRCSPNSSRCYQVTQDDGVAYVSWHTDTTHYVLVAQEQPDLLLRLAQTAQGILPPA